LTELWHNGGSNVLQFTHQ